MHNVLIIGCGNIAGGFDDQRSNLALPRTHAGAYLRHSGFRIAACVDPDEARRTAFAVRWNADSVADSVEALNACPGFFDVISICSPNSKHAEHLEQALALQPKLIFCEKPITNILNQGVRLVEACEAAGIKLAINYTRRWAPDVVQLAGELQRGEWGKVLSAIGTYTKGVVHNGGHMVDLLRMLLGPLELEAVGQPVFDYWDDDPSVPMMLRTSEGVPVQLTIGNAADYTLFELVLVTMRGEIAMRRGGLEWTIRRVQNSDTFAGYRELSSWEVFPGKYDYAMSRAIENISDALVRDAPLASTGKTGLAAQRLCETARNAALNASTSDRIIQ